MITMNVLINCLMFIIGFILGLIVMNYYDYYRNIQEFNNRQERYRRMI
jgi:hypothetical protein